MVEYVLGCDAIDVVGAARRASNRACATNAFICTGEINGLVCTHASPRSPQSLHKCFKTEPAHEPAQATHDLLANSGHTCLLHADQPCRGSSCGFGDGAFVRRSVCTVLSRKAQLVCMLDPQPPHPAQVRAPHLAAVKCANRLVAPRCVRHAGAVAERGAQIPALGRRHCSIASVAAARQTLAFSCAMHALAVANVCVERVRRESAAAERWRRCAWRWFGRR